LISTQDGCTADMEDRAALKACLEKRSYKKELIIFVASKNRVELLYHAALSARGMGYGHFITLGKNNLIRPTQRIKL
jgi:superfamily II DNA/RNA helicase